MMHPHHLLLTLLCVASLAAIVAVQPQQKLDSLQPLQRFTARRAAAATRNQHLLATDATALVTANPTYPVKDLHTMRFEIRGTGVTDAKEIQAIAAHKFFFTFHKDGRVDTALGFVVPSKSKAGSAPCKPNCYTAMYSMYDPISGTNPGGKLAHNGHIIGAQLGGDWSNESPINFFPHFPESNTYNGRWWRMEMIAREVKTTLELYSANCQVGIRIKFDYNGGMASVFQASGGIYEIDVEQACHGFLQKAIDNAKYTRSFVKNAQLVKDAFSALMTTIAGKANLGVPGYRLAVHWANDASDKADEVSTPTLYP